MENKIKHFFESIYDFFSNIYGWLTVAITLAITNDTTMLFSLLFTMLVADYITGIIASYIEDRKANVVPKVYFTESQRLRESGVKIVGYLLVIILSWFVSKYIYTDKIRLFGVLKEFNVLQLTLIICSSIEFWSNLENLKRSGFDVLGKISDGAKRVHGLIKDIKGK